MGEGDEGEWELALERISDTYDTAFGYLWAARDGLLDGTYTQLVLKIVASALQGGAGMWARCSDAVR